MSIAKTMYDTSIRTLLVGLTALGGLLAGCPEDIESTPGQTAIDSACLNDDDCGSGFCDTATGTCQEPPLPVAEAGDHRYTISGALVGLDGSASSDPLDRTLSYAWSLDIKPAASQATLTDADAVQPTFTPDVEGVYELTLRVTANGSVSEADSVAVFVFTPTGDFPTAPDGSDCITGIECESGKCQADICSPNNQPVANVGPVRLGELGVEAEFSGLGSNDPDGDPLSYQWQLLQLPSDSSVQLTASLGETTALTPDVCGTYVVRLVVNDSFLLSQPATTAVVACGALDKRPDGAPCTKDEDCQSLTCEGDVCKANERPVADPGAILYAALGTEVTVDGANSTDPEGNALTYEWSLFSQPDTSVVTLPANPDPASPTVSFTPDAVGLYQVRLVVNDGKHDSFPAWVTVVVGEDVPKLPVGDPCSTNDQCQSALCDAGGCAANQLPVALFTVPGTTGPGAPLTLDGTGSFDPEGSPLTYAWTILDGAPGAALNPTDAASVDFSAVTQGLYLVQLVVTSTNDGLSSLPTVQAVEVVVGGSKVEGEACVQNPECQSNTCLADLCAANAAPVADAGPPQFVPVGATVQLAGMATDDGVGDPLTYAWTVVSAPGTPALSDPTLTDPTFDAPDAGVYVFQLVASDGYLQSTPDLVTITVGSDPPNLPDNSPCGADWQCASQVCDAVTGLCAVNTPPIADAGPSQQVDPGVLVQLDGSGSSDPEGLPLIYQWSLFEKPPGSTATLDDEGAEMPSFTADQAGIYVARLEVFDGVYWSAPAAVSVTAGTSGLIPEGGSCTVDQECASQYCNGGQCEINLPPIADPGPPQLVSVGTLVTLDGTGSSDPEGAGLSFYWTIAGPEAVTLDSPTSPTPSFTPTTPGVYVATMTVGDGLHTSTGQAVVLVELDAQAADGEPCTVDADCLSGSCNGSTCVANARPVAVLTSTGTTAVGSTIQLDGSASYDDDNDPLTFTWTLVAAPEGSQTALSALSDELPTFVPDLPGQYVVLLVVNDGKLDSEPAIVTLAIDPNLAPVADLQTNIPADLKVDPTVKFNATGSSDPEGDALTYTWELLYAPPGSAAAVYETGVGTAAIDVDLSGAYIVQVTVSDGSASVEEVSVFEVVIAEPPTAVITVDTMPVAGCVTGVLSGANSTAPSGNIAKYQWELVVAPNGSAAKFDNPSAEQVALPLDLAGDYTIQLTVIDNLGEGATVTLNLTVTGADLGLANVELLLQDGAHSWFLHNDGAERWTYGPPTNGVYPVSKTRFAVLENNLFPTSPVAGGFNTYFDGSHEWVDGLLEGGQQGPPALILKECWNIGETINYGAFPNLMTATLVAVDQDLPAYLPQVGKTGTVEVTYNACGAEMCFQTYDMLVNSEYGIVQTRQAELFLNTVLDGTNWPDQDSPAPPFQPDGFIEEGLFINVDGTKDDWDQATVLWSDRVGDAQFGETDLVKVQMSEDDSNHCFYIEVDELKPNDTLRLHSTTDPQGEYGAGTQGDMFFEFADIDGSGQSMRAYFWDPQVEPSGQYVEATNAPITWAIVGNSQTETDIGVEWCMNRYWEEQLTPPSGPFLGRLIDTMPGRYYSLISNFGSDQFHPHIPMDWPAIDF